MSKQQLLCNASFWNGQCFERGCISIQGTQIVGIYSSCSEHAGFAAAEVHDLQEKHLLPGFIDAHAHPLIGGFEAQGANIRDASSVEEVVQAVKQYADENPELPWVLGEGFDLSISGDGNYLASQLDQAVSDRPVALRSSDIHTYWVNTKALLLTGITRHYPDPVDGVIERDEYGAPTGTLREWGAFMPLYRAIPREMRGDVPQALIRGLQNLRECGVTSAQDAWVDLQDFTHYVSAAKQGLPVRLNIAFRAEPGLWRQQIGEFVEAKKHADELSIAGFTANTIKFFADGIIEGGTAHMKDPYHEESCCGLPAWQYAEMKEAVSAFDSAGFQVHIHAIGDAAVAEALGAIEEARETNGPRDRRPVIAHAQVIDDTDYRRFTDNDVTFVFQPYWAKLDGVIRLLTNHRLQGERALKQYAYQTAIQHGVRMASSSDYPITTPDPFKAIAVAMSRHENGDMQDSWLPQERLSFDQALGAATQGAAYTQYAENRLALIAPGFEADLIACSSITDAPGPQQLFNACVTDSWLAGVHHSHMTIKEDQS